jgi:two-component system chemotaxis response regulator CheY
MPQASSISVLVVDDQLTMRALIRNALQQIGFKDIREAPDGEEALKNLLAKPANLVISDFNMPKMDGLALLRAVRSHPPIRQTAFVMLTGRADRELVQRAETVEAHRATAVWGSRSHAITASHLIGGPSRHRHFAAPLRAAWPDRWERSR